MIIFISIFNIIENSHVKYCALSTLYILHQNITATPAVQKKKSDMFCHRYIYCRLKRDIKNFCFFFVRKIFSQAKDVQEFHNSKHWTGKLKCGQNNNKNTRNNQILFTTFFCYSGVHSLYVFFFFIKWERETISYSLLIWDSI